MTIQSHIQKEIDSTKQIEVLNATNQKQINELYQIRMELTKRASEMEGYRNEIESLQRKMIENAQNQNESEKYMEIISQVDKHMKTLTKYLKSVVEKTEDPKIIEYTQRQINNIEKIHKEIKKVVYHRETLCASESSRIIQDITVGERDSHGSRGRQSVHMPPPKDDKFQAEIYVKHTDMSLITMATGSSHKHNKR